MNTLNRKGKATATVAPASGASAPTGKRAIVTLAPGDSIDLFEG